MIGRGIGIGLGAFILLALLAYFTPARAPLLRVAGETYPALQHRVEAQRRTLDTLQVQASNGPLSPAAQNLFQRTQRDFAASQQLLESWENGQARVSPFGFVSWCLDLFPWLAAFGLAFPVLGGLIAAQVAQARRVAPAPTRADAHPENPPSVPVTPARPEPPRAQMPSPTSRVPAAGIAAPPVPKPDFERIGKPAFPQAAKPAANPAVDPASLARHPALAPPQAPSEPTAPPPEAWGFRHPPTPTEGRRPPSPPVRSPHAFGQPDDDAPQAGA